MMTNELWIVGAILCVMGLVVSIGKQTWILAGFNERRVKNKALLGNLVGGFFLIIGALFIISGIGLVEFLTEQILIGILLVGIASLITFTHVKLVDKE